MCIETRRREALGSEFAPPCERLYAHNFLAVILDGAERDRFEKDASFCIHCGLCVRYCAEIKQANALGFIDRGVRKEISFIPEIAAKECWNCKECFELCPTEALQAAYVLVKSLSPHAAVESELKK